MPQQLPQLPFITKPQGTEKYNVGNAIIGELAIPKLGDLSINERRYLKQVTAELPDLRKEAVKMAKVIADDMEANLLDVYNALTAGDTYYLSNHLGEVIEFQDKMDLVSSQRQMHLATMIIKFRIEPAWETENTGNADLIHPDLVKEIAQFASKEENGWIVAKPEEEEPTTEEDLGKSPEA
jgi:siderophore synthetase component